MAKQALILTEKDILEIDLTLVRLIKESEAKAALLVDQDGRMLARKGFTRNLDCEALAALLAGSFASTKAIAKLVGEPEFSIMFHQGEHDRIQNNLVDENTLLCIIFDDRTTIGMVRVYAKEAADKIARTLATARESNRADDTDYSMLHQGAASALDSLFSEGSAEATPEEQGSAELFGDSDRAPTQQGASAVTGATSDDAEQVTEMDLRASLAGMMEGNASGGFPDSQSTADTQPSIDNSALVQKKHSAS